MSRVDLLTPAAGLVALAGALPLAALVLAARRSERARRVVGLDGRGGGVLVPAVAVVATCALAGLAAAQPVLRSGDAVRARSDAAAYVVVDTSRSMLAAETAGSATRLERARRAALRIRDRLGDVPTGIASFSDRALPHLFPSPDRQVFSRTLARAIRAGHPAPVAGGPAATDLTALAALPTANFFAPDVERRIVVVLTDAESAPVDLGRLQAAYPADKGLSVVLVRIGSADERVYDASGRPEPAYVPAPGSALVAEQFAAAVTGAAFGERSVARAAALAAQAAGSSGRTVAVARGEQRLALAPWILAAGAVPLALLVALRNVDLTGARGGTRRGALATLRPARRRSSVG